MYYYLPPVMRLLVCVCFFVHSVTQAAAITVQISVFDGTMVQPSTPFKLISAYSIRKFGHNATFKLIHVIN